MSRASQQKGASFERDVARDLTEWLTGERNPPALWRSVSSGGWTHRDVPDVGDLRPVSDEGAEFRRIFGAECKHRRDVPKLRHLLSAPSGGHLLRWWENLVLECGRYALCPLLVVRRSRYPQIAVLPEDVCLPPIDGRQLLFREQARALKIQIVMWDDFMSLSPEAVMDAAREWNATHWP